MCTMSFLLSCSNKDIEKEQTKKDVILVDNVISCSSPEPTENPLVPVNGITVSHPTLSLDLWGAKNITLSVNPINATNKKTTWKVDNDDIVDVKSFCESDNIFSISAKAEGIVNVNFTTEDGGYAAICIVSVCNKS